MSRRPRIGGPPARRLQARVFSALGNETRLVLVRRLCLGRPLSIAELSRGSRLTRQAVTKHLRVLTLARLVRGARRGRRRLFTFAPEPVEGARQYLELVSLQWGRTLARLKSFVESGAADRAR